MNTFTKFGILVVTILAVLVWLAFGGTKGSMAYFKTIAELNTMGDHAHGKTLKVGGEVEGGSVVRNGQQVSFVMHDLKQSSLRLKVVYNGEQPIPDTFKDGAQALASGTLGADGVFEANKIEAKCASKYEAKPVQSKGILDHKETL